MDDSKFQGLDCPQFYVTKDDGSARVLDATFLQEAGVPLQKKTELKKVRAAIRVVPVNGAAYAKLRTDAFNLANSVEHHIRSRSTPRADQVTHQAVTTSYYLSPNGSSSSTVARTRAKFHANEQGAATFDSRHPEKVDQTEFPGFAAVIDDADRTNAGLKLVQLKLAIYEGLVEQLHADGMQNNHTTHLLRILLKFQSDSTEELQRQEGMMEGGATAIGGPGMLIPGYQVFFWVPRGYAYVMAADAMGERHGSKNYLLEEKQADSTFTVTETPASSLCLVGDLSKGKVSTEKARDNLVNATIALYNNAGK